MDPQDQAKWAAARAALQYISDSQVVGLGTGSTAVKFLELLARRVAQEGLSVTAVPTSEEIHRRALELGLSIAPGYPDFGPLDVDVDGADEVDPAGNLIKGGGGALLREKLVALAARKVVIVVDPSKEVPTLGTRHLLPVEIVAFGWRQTLARLQRLGLEPRLRPAGEGLFRTDQGNLIADCAGPPITDPAGLQARLKAVPGVVETGLFVGLAHVIVTGLPDGGSRLRLVGAN
jgi:ribose 5-phosphate isomerase A